MRRKSRRFRKIELLMMPFELIEPRSLRKAATLLEGADGTTRVMGGGTAVMLMMKMGVLRPKKIVSLRAIEKRYSAIHAERGGGLRIGAMATLSALERSPMIRREAPVLCMTLRTLANVRVRNVATLGGHLAHADPHLDLPPVLIALGAEIVTIDAQGGRTLPVEALYAGYLETTLRPGELIAEVRVPRQRPRRAAYLKCTTRSADDWPALGVAVALDAEGMHVRTARIVVSAATDTPTRLVQAEDSLREVDVTDDRLARAADIAAGEAKITADAHGSAHYKKQLLRVYLARAVRTALSGQR
jgi:carbon-monoxide dehydrogenase medium subunit